MTETQLPLLTSFACRMVGDDHETTIAATSRGRAKSEYFLDVGADGQEHFPND